MTKSATRTQALMAQLALALVILFALAGLAWHGFSAPVRERIVTNILERPAGPMTFRFLLQPMMAAALAAGRPVHTPPPLKPPPKLKMKPKPPHRSQTLPPAPPPAVCRRPAPAPAKAPTPPTRPQSDPPPAPPAE